MKKLSKRILSLLLAVMMVVSVLPTMAFAAEETYTLTTVAPTAGKEYVICATDGTDYYALTNSDVNAAKSPGEKLTVSNGKITAPASTLVWAAEDASTGTYSGIAFMSGNYLHLNSSKIRVTTGYTNGTFDFTASGNGFTMCGNQNSRWLTFRDGSFGVSSSESDAAILYFFEKNGGSDEPIEDTGAPLAETIAAGDVVAIYYPKSSKVMSTESYLYTGTKNEKYELAALDGTVANNLLAVPEGAAEFEVYQDADGHFTFKSDAGYLYLDGTNVQLVAEQGDYTLFDLETAENGWYIKSVNAQFSGKAQYLEYYGGYFTCYGLNTSNPDIYTFQFYKTGTFDPGENPDPGPATEQYAKLNNTIEDGAQFVVYYNNDGLVMTDTVSGKGLAGETAELKGEFVQVTDTMSVLTAKVDENGSYTFTNADGKYLTSGATGNSLTFADAASDYSLWKIKAVDGGVHIVSVNAAYNNQAQALEIYNQVFTTFTEKDTQYYLFNLYQLTDEKPEESEPVAPTIEDGDYVIYVPAYSKALSATYSSNYNVGVDMALNDQGAFDKVMATEVWTLKNNTDGTFTLTSKSENQKLSMDTQYASMPLGKVYDTWTVEPTDAESLYYVKNMGRGVYIEWYADKDSFSGFKYIDEGKEGMFQIQFVPVEESQIEYPEAEPGEIVDGDYFIYSATAQGVMRYVNAGGAGAVSVEIEDGKVVFTGEPNGTGVYTIKNIPGGKYTIQLGNLYLGENTRTELTLNEKKDSSCEWIIAKAGEGYDGYTLMNANVKYNNSDTYLEYYASRGFCMYTMKTMSDLYVLNFYDATGTENNEGYVGERPESGDLPTEGTYLVYNPYAESVMGPQGGDDTARNISIVEAELVEENGETKLDAGNGALIFTVKTYEESGTTYYSFENNGKYLATDDDETLFLQENFTEYCKWSLEETEGGYVMYNKEAKYSTNRVCIEYFSGAFSGWTYKGGTNELFAFQFYPVADTYNTGYVVNPKVKFTTTADANLGLDFTVEFTLDDLGEELKATAKVAFGDTVKTYAPVLTGKTGSVTIPASDLTGESMTITIEASSKQANGETANYSGSKTFAILDEPVIVSVSPASMSSVTSGTTPEIAVEFANAGSNPVITLTVNDQQVAPTVTNGKVTYQAETMPDGKYVVSVKIERADGKIAEKTWTFNIGNVETNLYFGQLHSHTAEYSDGAGTLQDGLDYFASLPESANVQFVAFTDHSNYFDSTSAPNPAEALYDVSLMTAASTEKWNAYKDTVAAFNAENSKLIALAGFEMTWSGGPGHINTFNTPGIVSRNNTDLNNKTANAGMLAYYDLNVETNHLQDGPVVSQFNHPGTTFGYFDSFTGWTAERDEVMTMIEVGNGEGAVGSNGYFPSYEYYDMALSVGWHVAPTNNQDNHKGSWGNANTCRSVILTDDFTEDGLYEAMAQRRVYSTEDQNLSVVYTLNEVLQGGIIEGFTDETVKISVSLSDADTTDTIGKVEVIGENSRVLHTFDTVTSNTAELEAELENTSAYYYIRVTEGDGDIAVTAPVWVDQVAATKTNVTASVSDEGDAVEYVQHPLTVTIQNKEDTSITVNGYTITVDGVEVETKTAGDLVASEMSKSYIYNWTPETYGTHTVKVVFNVTVNGEAKTVSATKNIYVKGENYDTVVTIAEAKQGAEKEEFTVEGIVTSNASGYDQDTAFFDCIYIQDETGGLNIFPVAGNYQVGQKVRVHGAITYYCGEIELNLSEDYGGMIEVISDEITPLDPTKVTCADAMANENVGLLMQVSGTISRIHEDSTGVIDRIYVNDGSGTDACIYINGYIKNSQTGGNDFTGEAKVGNLITAIGIGSIDVDELGEVDYLHRLRVRDRSEIVCTTPGSDEPVEPDKPTPVKPGKPSTPSTSTPAEPEIPFTDVSVNASYYDAVKYVYEEDLMNGTSATKFAPTATLTRGMVATILYRIEGKPAAAYAGTFPDVASGVWYTDGVEWAAKNGIVTGYTTGKFGPEDPVTREQLAAMLYRYAEYKGYDVSKTADLADYTDGANVSEYAKTNVAWAAANGILESAGGKLRPREEATRAEVAVAVAAFHQQYVK